MEDEREEARIDRLLVKEKKSWKNIMMRETNKRQAFN